MNSGSFLTANQVLKLVLLLSVSFFFGCGEQRSSEEENAATERETEEAVRVAEPIVVFGVDGVEWNMILPMIKAGRLPHFAQLMRRGYYGHLETFIPTRSPVVWTSVATGKQPEDHGITNFYRQEALGRLTLFNSTDRKTKALWNILSDHGKSIATIGWWMTHPAEEVNGVMVAQTNTREQFDQKSGNQMFKGTLLKGIPGQVHPPERQNEMIDILDQVEQDLPKLTTEIFGEFSHPHSALSAKLWDNSQWAFRADNTYLRIALKLAERGAPTDVTLLYFGGPDVVSHRFWRYMQPDLYRFKPTAEEIENFGNIVADYYAYMDQSLGQLMEAFGPETTFLIVSDHGMHPVNLEKEFNPDDPPADFNSAAHEDAPPGIFLAAGPAIRALPAAKPIEELVSADLNSIGSVLDVTPTILAMKRVPLAEDMAGHVLSEIFAETFEIARQPAVVPTHDTKEFMAQRADRAALRLRDEERIKQLRSLGYIK